MEKFIQLVQGRGEGAKALWVDPTSVVAVHSKGQSTEIHLDSGATFTVAEEHVDVIRQINEGLGQYEPLREGLRRLSDIVARAGNL